MSEEMRRKYGHNITSEEYIRTGKPRNASSEPRDEAAEIARLLEINQQNTAKAIKQFRQRRAKRKGPEYKIRFE